MQINISGSQTFVRLEDRDKMNVCGTSWEHWQLEFHDPDGLGSVVVQGRREFMVDVATKILEAEEQRLNAI